MTIYVSNLGKRVTEESLRATFAAHGEVSSASMTLDLSESGSTAALEMPDNTEALIAMNHIHGCVMDGRSIQVTEQMPLLQTNISKP